MINSFQILFFSVLSGVATSWFCYMTYSNHLSWEVGPGTPPNVSSPNYSKYFSFIMNFQINRATTLSLNAYQMSWCMIISLFCSFFGIRNFMENLKYQLFKFKLFSNPSYNLLDNSLRKIMSTRASQEETRTYDFRSNIRHQRERQSSIWLPYLR